MSQEQTAKDLKRSNGINVALLTSAPINAGLTLHSGIG